MATKAVYWQCERPPASSHLRHTRSQAPAADVRRRALTLVFLKHAMFALLPVKNNHFFAARSLNRDGQIEGMRQVVRIRNIHRHCLVPVATVLLALDFEPPPPPHETTPAIATSRSIGSSTNRVFLAALMRCLLPKVRSRPATPPGMQNTAANAPSMPLPRAGRDLSALLAGFAVMVSVSNTGDTCGVMVTFCDVKIQVK